MAVHAVRRFRDVRLRFRGWAGLRPVRSVAIMMNQSGSPDSLG